MRAVQYRQLARSVAAIRTRAVCLCLVAAGVLFSTAKAEDFASVRTEQAPPPSPSKSSDARVLAQHSQHADFQKQAAPDAVKQIADWVVNSSDNHGLPFVILHKPEAKVFVFDKDGHLKGTASDPGGPFCLDAGPRPWEIGCFVGGLSRRDFASPGHQYQPRRTAAGADRIARAPRPSHFLWLHQCPRKILRCRCGSDVQGHKRHCLYTSGSKIDPGGISGLL
jgi:hypothetical protein